MIPPASLKNTEKSGTSSDSAAPRAAVEGGTRDIAGLDHAATIVRESNLPGDLVAQAQWLRACRLDEAAAMIEILVKQIS